MKGIKITWDSKNLGVENEWKKEENPRGEEL